MVQCPCFLRKQQMDIVYWSMRYERCHLQLYNKSSKLKRLTSHYTSVTPGKPGKQRSCTQTHQKHSSCVLNPTLNQKDLQCASSIHNSCKDKICLHILTVSETKAPPHVNFRILKSVDALLRLARWLREQDGSLCKQEDLGLDPQHPWKKLHVALCTRQRQENHVDLWSLA